VPRKFTLSPTRLRTFYTCPAKYRLEYVDKLGKFYRRPRAGFSFGASLHNVLEQLQTQGGAANVPLEALTESLDQKWQSQGYQSAEQEAAYRLEAVRILETWHKTAIEAVKTAPPDAPPAPKTLFTEKTLRQELSPDVVLSGRVDRIDEHHDGLLEIVDYKSGRESVDPDDVKNALAMGIYQALLKHLFPERRVQATLVALRTGAAATHEQTNTEREILLSECLETGEKLLQKNWETVLPVLNDHCDDCDFRPHCDRHWKRFGGRHGDPDFDF
jgi:putative RecB family exonuclease